MKTSLNNSFLNLHQLEINIQFPLSSEIEFLFSHIENIDEIEKFLQMFDIKYQMSLFFDYWYLDPEDIDQFGIRFAINSKNSLYEQSAYFKVYAKEDIIKESFEKYKELDLFR